MSNSDVSYYCSWIKPRFDRYFSIKIGNRESCSPLEEPFKGWLEVGDKCYGGSHEWNYLRYYILEKITSKKLLTDDEWSEKVRKECEDILKGRG
jgi:hypothetical protein